MENRLLLHLMSAFPPLSEVFVLREIRQLRDHGWKIIIGPLRPLHKTPSAEGFEDLVPFVCQVTWLSWSMLEAALFFLVSRPFRVLKCLKLILKSVSRLGYVPKMTYILFSAMGLAYRYRNSRVGLVRAHFLHTEALGARFVSELLNIPYSVTTYTVFVQYARPVIEDIVRHATFLVADTKQASE